MKHSSQSIEDVASIILHRAIKEALKEDHQDMLVN
jgi:hypothetical protein